MSIDGPAAASHSPRLAPRPHLAATTTTKENGSPCGLRWVSLACLWSLDGGRLFSLAPTDCTHCSVVGGLNGWMRLCRWCVAAVCCGPALRCSALGRLCSRLASKVLCGGAAAAASFQPRQAGWRRLHTHSNCSAPVCVFGASEAAPRLNRFQHTQRPFLAYTQQLRIMEGGRIPC
jgi:hypothetical protein